MKKTQVIYPLLLGSLFLVSCQYETVISTSEARSQLTAIYAAQEIDDEPLSFSIDEVSVTSSIKDATTENAHYQYVVDTEHVYYHYLAYLTDSDNQVTTDYEYFAYVQGEQYYTVINRLSSDGQYERFYHVYSASDAYVSKNYASLTNEAIEDYKGTDYQILFLDEGSGLLTNNANLDYTYFDLQAFSSGDDTLIIKYRLIDQNDNTIVTKVSWESFYLSYAAYQFSNDNDYLISTTTFSQDVSLEYPVLTDYTLV